MKANKDYLLTRMMVPFGISYPPYFIACGVILSTPAAGG